MCPKCEIEKELEEFPINNSRKDGRGRVCKLCQNEYTRNHYKNNKKQYFERNKRRTREAKEYIIEYKKNSVCKCGESRWWVLDFHHIDDKKEEVINLISYGIETVKKEIEKCEVLCSNCHRDLHYQENHAPVAQLDSAIDYESIG